jgi:hypothetical protein
LLIEAQTAKEDQRPRVALGTGVDSTFHQMRLFARLGVPALKTLG